MHCFSKTAAAYLANEQRAGKVDTRKRSMVMMMMIIIIIIIIAAWPACRL